MVVKILGHEKEQLFLEKILKPKVHGRTLHFTGPSRLGKRHLALRCALQLRGEGEKELVLVLRGDHPDITLFSPEGKIAVHPAEAVRAVIDKCRERPYQGDYRILIIDGAERMQGVSSNTLLKTLEEPLKTTFIFLISERKEKILPTILSRAIEVTFSPLSKELLRQNLQGVGKIDKELAISLSRGSYSRAKEYFVEGLPSWRDPLIDLLYRPLQTYFSFREEIKKIVEPIVALKEETPLNYFEVVHELLARVIGWHRDLHLIREGGSHSSLCFPDQVEALEHRLERGNVPSLNKVLDAVEVAHLGIERSNSLQTTLESLFLGIAIPS